MSPIRFRAIAIHLPQFHPVPDNDRWWGRGFTEWRNVAKARPLFRGHRQPRIPGELGFYDLRLPAVREAQAELAREHGIHGFCYYHYWFHGRRLLEGPVDEILASKRPDFPFCLCWANESWSRTWLGDDRQMLLEQTYSPEDDRAHARWLVRAFADPRYIRVNNRPVFVIYRPTHLPDARACLARIREECIKAGVGDPYLIGADGRCAGKDTRRWGFDNTLRFEPQLGALPIVTQDRPGLRRLLRNMKRGVFSARLKVYDYTKARMFMTFFRRDYPDIPCVLVGWDNSPRRGAHGTIFINGTPAAFGHQLRLELDYRRQHPPADNDLFFLNAWNEWAEGNYLEPDIEHGRGFLEQVRDAFGAPAVTYPEAESVPGLSGQKLSVAQRG